jgi:hypothetical protein
MALDPERHETERRRSLEPYEVKPTPVRASDADRDRAVAQLRQHLAEGRLTFEEFSERLDEAYEALTTADIQQALRELPHVRYTEPQPLQARRRGDAGGHRARALRAQLVSYLLVNAFLVAIWLATCVSAGRLLFFWPVFPILGWGFGLAMQAWQLYGEGDD